MHPAATTSLPSIAHSSAETRETPRVDVEAEISFYSEDNFYKGFSENISEGGLFVVTYVPHRCGEVLTVHFTLPGIERVLEARAEVRWQRQGDAEQGLAPGVGMRFVSLSDADRAVVERFVRRREPLFFEE